MNEHWLHTPSGRPRARALGVPFDGQPGPCNAITDVAGVRLGYTTLIHGDGPLLVGRGPVRTGVTAILPRSGDDLAVPVFAGYHSFNGNGEMSGTHFIAEAGVAAGPITLTNTHSCGIARDASIEWLARRDPAALHDTFSLPVAAETYDGHLNDINGFHVHARHVHAALDAAADDTADSAVEEGSVGGGTGMKTFGLKAGSGTASRQVTHAGEQHTIGVFVQSNFGSREQLIVRGHALGRELHRWLEPDAGEPPKSSIIVIIATDAPLLPHQLARLARRATVGVARTGGIGQHGSGDIFMAFSTANRAALIGPADRVATARFVPDPAIDPYFEAVAQGVEEAILNSLVASTGMVGRDGHRVPALPHAALRTVFAGEQA